MIERLLGMARLKNEGHTSWLDMSYPTVVVEHVVSLMPRGEDDKTKAALRIIDYVKDRLTREGKANG